MVRHTTKNFTMNFCTVSMTRLSDGHFRLRDLCRRLHRCQSCERRRERLVSAVNNSLFYLINGSQLSVKLLKRLVNILK